MTTRQRAIAEALNNRNAFVELPNENQLYRYELVELRVQERRKSKRCQHYLHCFLANTFINDPPQQLPPINVNPPPVYTFRRRYNMVEIAKVFSSLPKLNADGSNYREWYHRVKINARVLHSFTSCPGHFLHD